MSHFCDISVNLLYSTLLAVNLQLNLHHKPWLCSVQPEHNGDWLAVAWGFVIAGQQRSIDLNKHVRHHLLPPHHLPRDCVKPLLILALETLETSESGDGVWNETPECEGEVQLCVGVYTLCGLKKKKKCLFFWWYLRRQRSDSECVFMLISTSADNSFQGKVARAYSKSHWRLTDDLIG